MINTTKFLIIDDDITNNTLSRFAIRKVCRDAEILEFTVPEEGLNYIRENFHPEIHNPTIFLLDLNMPTMTGWKFLEKFRDFPQAVLKQFKIYILSSSIDPADKLRALNNPLVKDFIEKPLTFENIDKLMD